MSFWMTWEGRAGLATSSGFCRTIDAKFAEKIGHGFFVALMAIFLAEISRECLSVKRKFRRLS
jgi:hypothetical protein